MTKLYNRIVVQAQSNFLPLVQCSNKSSEPLQDAFVSFITITLCVHKFEDHNRK